MELNTADEISILDDAQPVELDSDISPASATGGTAAKAVLVCEFSRENHESAEIFAVHDHIIKELCLLLKISDEHEKKLKFLIQRNKLYSTQGVLINKFRFTLAGEEKSVEAFLVENGVQKLLKLSDQVVLVDRRHRFGSGNVILAGTSRVSVKIEYCESPHVIGHLEQSKSYECE